VEFENRAHHPTDIKDTDEYACPAVDFTCPGCPSVPRDAAQRLASGMDARHRRPQPGQVLSRDVIRLPDAGHERRRSRVLEESNNRDLKK